MPKFFLTSDRDAPLFDYAIALTLALTIGASALAGLRDSASTGLGHGDDYGIGASHAQSHAMGASAT